MEGSASTDTNVEMVTIPLEKLRELEALALKHKKRNEYANKSAKQYAKEHPDIHRKNGLNSYHKNKDAINEKRRAAYKVKKEAETAAANAPPGQA